MTCGPKKYCQSSLKDNQIFLYFIKNLMSNLVIYVYPRPLPASRDPRHTFTTVALGHWGGVLMFLFCFVVFFGVYYLCMCTFISHRLRSLML